MSEVDRIADLLIETYEGDASGSAWYGPPLRNLLRSVSSEAAARRPLPERHTIWELVLHVAANIDFVLARLEGRVLELSNAADWPEVLDISPPAWAEALATLDSKYDELLTRVRGLNDEELGTQAVGRSYSVYVMLHGIIDHNVYHAGQVALLREKT